MTLTLHLRLYTVSESFFDPERPLRRLLFGAEMKIRALRSALRG